MRRGPMSIVWAMALACGPGDPEVPAPAPAEAAAPAAPEPLRPDRSVLVTVTLDGEPAEGVLVMQGGGEQTWRTDAAGQATVAVLGSVPGDPMVVASHPDARIEGADVFSDDPVTVALTRFDPSDNEAYVFQLPGGPDRGDSTDECSHCHVVQVREAWDSVHDRSARNPAVLDLYEGTGSGHADAAACEAVGGLVTGGPDLGCVVGDGVLPSLNACYPPCDAPGDRAQTGACADCHAPGMDGRLGGRDLLDAVGLARERGVHCDVCHRVAEVDLDATAPGVAGALRLVRPSEPATSPIFGDWAPLTFGPYHDVVNPRMGAVQRDHFTDGRLCAGCHELEQEVLVPGESVDPERWPSGRLPIHSTWSEWSASPMNPSMPCNGCHMAVDADVLNSADLEEADPTSMIGMAGGWIREPGTVRSHAFEGPRNPASTLLRRAATVEVEGELEADVVTARVTVRNAGAGHAIPTGEPLRSLLLLVEARCGDEVLVPVGGAVVPDHAGFLERRDAGVDWSRWPDAEAGQRLVVVRGTGAWLDYQGFGPFGDGRFAVEEKGLREEELAGVSTVLSVAADGTVELDTPLATGERVLRVPAASLPEPGAPAVERAGSPGFAFARVLAHPHAGTMVPHFLAVDVVADNRLLPGAAWTSEHRFATTCSTPEVEARLIHRAWPLALARDRGWETRESAMAEASTQLGGGRR